MPRAVQAARTILQAGIVLLALSGVGTAATCGNFEFARLSDEQIFSQFEGAVLRISAGGSVGTGFLIDARQGYVLTAAHVVQPVLEKRGVAISATAPAFGSNPLKLVLVRELSRTDDKIDLALLQLEQRDALSSVFPIDISFRPPPSGMTAYTLGYSRGEPDLSKQPVTVTKLTGEDGIVVKSNSYPGDSGSPLLSPQGVAIGIARARINDSVAHYIPMSDAMALLKDIPLSASMTDLDDQIRSKRIALSDLSLRLKPARTTTSMRNVELVSWAARIDRASIPRYADARPMFECPIVPAFWQRSLDDAAGLLSPIMTAALKAQTTLMLAQNATALERKSLAANHYAAAVKEYQLALNAYTKDNSDGLVYAFCQTGKVDKLASARVGNAADGGMSAWLNIAKSRVATEPQPCDSVTADADFASMLKDYSFAAFGQSAFQGGTMRASILDEAKRAAAVSVAADEPAHGPANAHTMILLGDVLYRSGKYKQAADAFATVHRLTPDDTASVVEKWNSAMGRAASTSPEIKMVRERGIAAAPTLTTKEALDLALPDLQRN